MQLTPFHGMIVTFFYHTESRVWPIPSSIIVSSFLHGKSSNPVYCMSVVVSVYVMVCLYSCMLAEQDNGQAKVEIHSSKIWERRKYAKHSTCASPGLLRTASQTVTSSSSISAQKLHVPPPRCPLQLTISCQLSLLKKLRVLFAHQNPLLPVSL